MHVTLIASIVLEILQISVPPVTMKLIYWVLNVWQQQIVYLTSLPIQLIILALIALPDAPLVQEPYSANVLLVIIISSKMEPHVLCFARNLNSKILLA